MLEHMIGHQMGPPGRELVAYASQLAPVSAGPEPGAAGN